jgi:general secretion pathway protein J
MTARVRGAERGFTMMELLIALAIVAALLAVAFGGLRVGMAAWRQGEDRVEAHQHVRGITMALARVVAGAYPYTATRGEAPEPQILFAGAENRLELVTQAPPGAFAVPVAFAAVVIEQAEGEAGGLVVRQRALPNREPFTDATTILHDRSVTSLKLAYLDEAGAWQDTWDAETEKTLPRAVRLSVTATTGAREETLPPMTISLRVLTP